MTADGRRAYQLSGPAPGLQSIIQRHIAMTSRISLSLLVAALAFFVLPSYGTAQAPRRPTSPLQAATRALLEGRFDEADAMADKLDVRDPERRGDQGAGGDRARPLRGGRSAAAAGRGARADERSGARAGAAAEDARTPRRDGDPRAGRGAGRHEPRSARSWRAAGRALRALGRFKEANAAYRDAATDAPGDAAIQTGWGELFLEKYKNAEALKSFQMALQADPALGAGAGRLGARARRRQPAAGGRARASARSRSIRRRSTRTCSSPSKRPTPASTTKRARRWRRRSRSTRRASRRTRCSAALAYVEDKPQEFEAEVAKTLAIAPSYGEVYRVAGELAAHNYRFDEAVDADAARAGARSAATRARSADLGIHLLRTGDEPGARDGARGVVQGSIRSTRVTYNLLQMMDTLDKFVTVRDGDVVMRMHKDEAPVLQEYAMPLAQQALSTLSTRYEFTPHGPILIEIFPEARRLRGPQRRPARHDRRARRLLRPRRDDGFAAGAAAGRVPVGSDALARARARHHAADVEPAACRAG